MAEEVYINLEFFDENLNPDEITRLIGIQPTKSGRKGALIPGGRKFPITEGMWTYKYIITETPWDVGKALAELLPLVESKPELLQYCRDNHIYLEFAVVSFLAQNTPIVILEPSLMKRMAAINAAIDFDTYFIPADEPE